MSILFYKRPDYVARASGPMDPANYERMVENKQKPIPPELSFDMIVANRAMPPCSLEDFMGYLLYVSHDAENLQFYLWLQDYTRRFDQAPKSEQIFSPMWEDKARPQQIDQFLNGYQKPPPAAIGKGEIWKKHLQLSQKTLAMMHKKSRSFLDDSRDTERRIVNSANARIGLKRQSSTIQLLRSEIDQVIATYLAPGSPRELNVSHKARTECLHALQYTIHPSALAIPAAIVASTLRNHSHPNFIRWSVANGNQPRIIFGRVLGALNIVFGFLIAILLMLSYKSRWWRLWAIPAWIMGFSFLLAGSNGICLVLYVMKNRHVRPCEQFSDSTSDLLGSPFLDWRSDLESDTKSLSGSDSTNLDPVSKGEKLSGGKRRHWALETFGTANSYGHEVWVDKYRAKMIFRKIFDTQIWVKNENLRIIQDKVAYQAIAWSVIVTIPLTVLFTALPQLRLF